MKTKSVVIFGLTEANILAPPPIIMSVVVTVLDQSGSFVNYNNWPLTWVNSRIQKFYVGNLPNIRDHNKDWPRSQNAPEKFSGGNSSLEATSVVQWLSGRTHTLEVRGSMPGARQDFR
jgi:hypothetical protein